MAKRSRPDPAAQITYELIEALANMPTSRDEWHQDLYDRARARMQATPPTLKRVIDGGEVRRAVLPKPTPVRLTKRGRTYRVVFDDKG